MNKDSKAGKPEEGEKRSVYPSISLPKGGGAIRGIGEKFAANPVTGTGSMNVPIATSPGRSGFGPQISLSYDSGSGNGPFGFGWSLSLPAITRKTDKGLPQYRDAEDSDVFILSGAEDLVPLLVQNKQGEWEQSPRQQTVDGVIYQINRYRPRIEGLFARIERWTNTEDPADVHWRSISKDNVLTLYGKDAESRIYDPAHPVRVFSWLICETRDDKGNAIVYRYRREDGIGVDLSKPHERNRGDRDDVRRQANRYIDSIQYGNQRPLLNDAGRRPSFLQSDDLDNADWMFQVVFDYHEPQDGEPELKPDQIGEWNFRADPFSTYRPGFEVRTTRLCQRVLMFHHIPDVPVGEPDNGEVLKGYDGLVRSTDFTYSHEQDPDSACNPVYTFLRAVTQTGYNLQDDSYVTRSLPPLEFKYTQPIVQGRIQEVDPENLENLPIGLDDASYQWTDLHGEGIPGILTEQAGSWYYKHNLSPIPDKTKDGRELVKAKFAPLVTIAPKPNVALGGGAQVMDLAGDGQPDIVVMEGPTPGLYEHDDAEGWHPFRPFTSRLNLDTRDPNVKFVDLDGDGHADVLITEENAFVWHASLAEEGFGPAQRVAQALDEEKGPRLVFDDATQSIHLADLSGDGLTDLVRIRNGEVCYWPNLGYCKFGPKVTMDNAPHFDNPDQFNQSRIRLADIDGSGTTDIIYLHRDGVRLYFNQSGNSWSIATELGVFPRVDDLVNIVPTDLLGNGTACLVWSSPLSGDAGRQMQYINLMGDKKPHLLERVVNNLGAETRVTYAPSTQLYLLDKQNGTSWLSRLPFPVHVVARVETHDHISGNRFVTRYAYHHGYFDDKEREFRGFGMVEQWDSEEFYTLTDGNRSVASNEDKAFHVPPVHTKTWFHTGAWSDRHQISMQYAREYYGAPKPDDPDFEVKLQTFCSKALLPDTVLPTEELTSHEERDACRALKGSMLRQEVYADDAPEGTTEEIIQRSQRPYTVTEQNFAMGMLQPQGENRHGVFFTHSRESISYHHERNPEDPRVQHALTLEVDDYGNVLKEVAIGYGRKQSDLTEQSDRDKQTTTLITYTENVVTNAVNTDTDYRTPLPAETRTYEVRKPEPGKNGNGGRTPYGFKDMLNIVIQASDGRHDITYEDIEFEKANQAATDDSNENENYFRRLIEHVRILYRPDNLGKSNSEEKAPGFPEGPGGNPEHNDPLKLLPLKILESHALPGESYKLAFTPGLAKQIYVDSGKLKQNELDNILANEGKYVHFEDDANWWIPSGRVFYSPNTDDDAENELVNARGHFFLPRRYRDPFFIQDNGETESVVKYDTHDLLMVQTRDALGNQVVSQNDYRVLQPKEVTDPNKNRVEVAFDALGLVVGTAVKGKLAGDGSTESGDHLDTFVADLIPGREAAFYDAPKPHDLVKDLLQDATTRIIYDLDCYRTKGQPPFAVTIARENHVNMPPPDGVGKCQVSFSYSDGFGREIQKKIQAEPETPGGPLRWVGSGWTIFNNKGKPLRQYEPFFSDLPPTEGHKFEYGKEVGVSPVMFYDPLGRVIATLHPNHTFEKVVFDPWKQTTFDVNDTVDLDPRTDPHIKGYVEEYFTTRPADWSTWYDQRKDGVLGQWEKDAAGKAKAHADTPTTAHFDTLGRAFLTLAHNGFDENNHPIQYPTRIELDIEGNQRVVRDAITKAFDAQGNEIEDPLGRIVMRYDYYIAGPEESREDDEEDTQNPIHQISMEAGKRWTLYDVAGNPVRAWDSRGFMRRMTYDGLRRPAGLYVTENGTERLTEKTVYGESQGHAANHHGQIYQQYDQAGIVTHEHYDFKGNLLRSSREVQSKYAQITNWEATHPPGEIFSGSTTFDALNRTVTLTSPDKSITRHTYNEANLLQGVDVALRGATSGGNPDWTPFVTNIDYDAKGQRRRIDYGNGVSTSYEYDPLTFRLVHLLTRRNDTVYPDDCPKVPDPDWPGCGVQNLHYSYDPAGNITHIRDEAQQTIFFRNKRVEPSNDYTYDAIYRLIQARGREHLGQMAHSYNDMPRCKPSHPGDGSAMGTYTERYIYDAVGNFLKMQHRGSDPDHAGWTRYYTYNENSLTEDGKKSNRLSSTQVGNATPEKYAYDPHGNMLAMPQLQLMQWDFENQLQMTQRQKVDIPEVYGKDKEGEKRHGERTYYVYDASGERVRKFTLLSNGNLKNERIYLGGFEVYREYKDNESAVVLERETLHVMDDQQRIALVESKTIDTNNDPTPPQLIRYQLGNHLYSTSLELNQNGRIISYEEYSPYGSSVYQSVDKDIKSAGKRYRYTGRERDEESGLNYHVKRYYAPWVQRWISTDPLWINRGINTYLYSDASPQTRIDLDGMQPIPAKVTRERVYVALYDAKDPAPSKQRLFRVQAKQWAKDHKGKAYPFDSNKLESILKEVQQNNHRKDIVLYFFGHGAGLIEQISTNDSYIGKVALAKRLRGILRIGVISFKNCSVGNKGGLADYIQKKFPQSEVYGHTTMGHVTINREQRSSKSDTTLRSFLQSKIAVLPLATGRFAFNASPQSEMAKRIVKDLLKVDTVRIPGPKGLESLLSKNVPTREEESPRGALNAIFRDIGAIGFERLWKLVIGNKSVDLSNMNFTQVAKQRFLRGISILKGRFRCSLAVHQGYI